MQMFLLKGLARRAFQNDRLPPRHYGSGSPAPPRTWRLWWRLWYQGLRDRASAVTSGTLFLVSNRSPCDAHRGIAARSPRPAGRCSQCRREIMRPVNGSSMIRPRTQAAPKMPAASFPTAPAMKAYYSIGFLCDEESKVGKVRLWHEAEVNRMSAHVGNTGPASDCLEISSRCPKRSSGWPRIAV